MDLISVSRRDGLAFDVRVRNREIVSDRSPEDGGRGEGFSPVELLAASVGACIAMAVQGWWDACGNGEGDVSVAVTAELHPDPRRIGTIVADVELPPGIPESRRKALRRVVELCPIHQTLQSPPRVDVEFVFNLEEQADPALAGSSTGRGETDGES